MNCTICNKKTKKTIDQLIYFCKECIHYQYFPIEISATFNHFEISTSLENFPIEPNVQSIKDHSNDILTVMNDVDENLANRFREALDNGEDAVLADMASSIRRDPKYSKFSSRT